MYASVSNNCIGVCMHILEPLEREYLVVFSFNAVTMLMGMMQLF